MPWGSEIAHELLFLFNLFCIGATASAVLGVAISTLKDVAAEVVDDWYDREEVLLAKHHALHNGGKLSEA
jgi:hypothetical protein